jgi:heat shock protein HslJ
MNQLSPNTRSLISILATGLLLFAVSCTAGKKSIVWVNSMKTDCDAGAGLMQCIQITPGEDTDNAAWELFYSDIEGFSFEPGYFQRIEIREIPLDTEDVPADAASNKYVLVNTIEKKFDSRYILHDIWVPEFIGGEAIDRTAELPQMELNLTTMKVMGTNGCNNFNGKITSLTSTTIGFGPIMSTRKMCEDMTIPDRFDRALNASVGYKLSDGQLAFLDSEDRETMIFKKVD